MARGAVRVRCGCIPAVLPAPHPDRCRQVEERIKLRRRDHRASSGLTQTAKHATCGSGAARAVHLGLTVARGLALTDALLFALCLQTLCAGTATHRTRLNRNTSATSGGVQLHEQATQDAECLRRCLD